MLRRATDGSNAYRIDLIRFYDGPFDQIGVEHWVCYKQPMFEDGEVTYTILPAWTQWVLRRQT